MLESLKQWAAKTETWFNTLLASFILWLLGKAFKFARARMYALWKEAAQRNKAKIAEFATDDVLTYKAIASREAWLVIFTLGSLSWFAYVTLSPFRVLLDLSTPIFLLTMSPAWILEILYLSRDSFTKDVLIERKRRRA